MNEKLLLYMETLKKETSDFLKKIDETQWKKATDLIIKAKERNSRVHITGIGKPSHVAEYIAALLSSTGTASYFLDATEAIHGSAGQIQKGDVVISISNSGQTEELKRTMLALQKLGVNTIGVTGNPDSWLAKNSDVFLFAGVNQEGDDFNKPPRLSILAEIIVLQSLSILLQESSQLDMDKYYLWHPGGALGESIQKSSMKEATL